MTWALWLLPAVGLGFVVSDNAARFLDSGRTKPAVLVVSTTAAILLLARELLGL